MKKLFFVLFFTFAMPLISLAVGPTHPIIQEFSINGNEWVEILNTQSSPLDLSVYSIDLMDSATSTPVTHALSGTLPSNGIFVFNFSGTEVRDDGGLINLSYSGTPIQQVSYGDASESSDIQAPLLGESAYYGGESGWQIADNVKAFITKGWFNPGSAVPDISSIVAYVNSSGVLTNLGTPEIPDPSKSIGMYFEKSDYGRVAFNSLINLSGAETLAFFQSVSEYFSASAGQLTFDARLAPAIQSMGARITLYNITGVTDSEDAFNKLIVKDDSGTVISKDIITNYAYDSVNHTFSFDTAHFTSFEIDTTAPTVTALGDGSSKYQIDGSVDLVFSEELSSDSKTIIESSITSGVDSPLNYSWNEGTLTITSSGVVYFDNDVRVSFSDIAGNTTSNTIIIDSNYIQQLISEADEGATINIPAGTYNECLNINNSIVLNGVSSTTVIIDISSCSPGISISASDVSIRNFTLRNTNEFSSETAINASTEGSITGLSLDNLIMTDGNLNRGLYISDVSGQITNSNIQNFCSGIYINSSSNFSVSGNTIKENGKMAGCYLSTGIDIMYSSNIVVTNNDISNNDVGIRVNSDCEGEGCSSNIVVANNKITGNNGYEEISAPYGIRNDGNTPVKATLNWWGNSSGPTHSENAGGSGDISSDWVNYSPWYRDVNMTSLSGVTSENEDGNKEYSIESDFDIESGIFRVTIPAGTKITGLPAWDGEFDAPSVVEIVSRPSQDGYTTEMSSAHELGFPSGKLILDRAAKIILLGEAGKRVGYTRTGESFTEIATTCEANTQVWADANLGTEGDCKIDSGSDLVIWTKHFTQFATFRMTQDTTNDNNNNTSSGSGIAGSGPNAVGYVRTYPSVVVVLNHAPVPQLVDFFTIDMMIGTRHEQVKKLQELLAGDKEIYPEGQITGFYGPLTSKAVKAFQKKNGISQAGRVGPITRAKLNELFRGMKNTPSADNSIEEQIKILQEKLKELMKLV